MSELNYTRLTTEQIEAQLLNVPSWKVIDGALTRAFDHFESYPEAVLFAMAVAYTAETLNHHPDIHLGYKTVSISMTTHDANGGLTAYDFELARRINMIS